MIYLIDLEYVETRYTAQWKTHLPQILADKTAQNVTVIEGPELESDMSSGSFLDFGATNIYKSAQTAQISQFFKNDEIKDGDHFLFADAWHPGIINLKYMADLLDKDITIHALWHAGSYDPHDFLGRKIGNKPWVRHTELAFFDAIDKNYFASSFHINMFVNTLFPNLGHSAIDYVNNKIVRTGWPMEYLQEQLSFSSGYKKENLILFPHRLAPEKQLDIFNDLAMELPQYEWYICQGNNLTKGEYHQLLYRAKMVFSANLQETLGISCYEILCAEGMPVVPNRLSYEEMYEDNFLYPSEWTKDWKSYQEHKEDLKTKIVNLMESYDSNQVKDDIWNNRAMLEEQYFSATNLYKEFI